MQREKKDRIVVFNTTETQFDALQTAAAQRDSLSSLMRQIVQEWIAVQSDQPTQNS